MDYNLVIHKSHTKQYLIKIIQNLSLPIKYNSLTKKELLEEFDGWILEHYDNEFNENNLELKNVADLIDFLQEPAEKEQNYETIKNHKLLQLKARQVLAYINNGCDITRSFYKNTDEIRDDVILMAKQGHKLNTCRRAVYKYNGTQPPSKQISLANKTYSMEEMKYKLREKKMCQPQFSKKVGKFTIIF